MPYITQSKRDVLDPLIVKLVDEMITSADGSVHGDLNYIITRLMHELIKDLGLSYDMCQDLIGTLESAKLEFYRRVVAPYEDEKIMQNGDVLL